MKSEHPCLFIEGGHRLAGEVRLSGAKNAALPALAATILAPGAHLLENVPRLLDVSTMLELLDLLGAKVERRGQELVVDTSSLDHTEAPYGIVSRMRASVLVLGPLLAREGHARVALPGGCPIGKRPIDFHLRGLAAMGARIEQDHGYVKARAPRGGLRGAEIVLDFPSVTATENLMMAASLARGETVIRNAAKEPEVVALGEMIRGMGGVIEGLGTETIFVQGRRELSPARTRIIPDRIEAGTYLMIPGVTGGEVVVSGAEPRHLETVIAKLREIGLLVEVEGDRIRSRRGRHLRPVKVQTAPYPGFPTDLQAQVMALLATVRGTSVIVENIFENRFHHVDELRRLGANIEVEGRVAVVNGVKRLQAAPVRAVDLRASASLVLAALGAEGVTEIRGLCHLKRGYEALTEKLAALGARIREEPCRTAPEDDYANAF